MTLASSSGGSIAAHWVVLLIVIGLYFIPTLVAGLRHVPNVGSVAVVNVFLGWTFVGWVVALAMACRSGGNSTVVNVGPQGYGAPGYMPQGYGQPQRVLYPPADGSPAAQGFSPGWYPRESGGERWWDGQAWTEHVR